MNRNFLRNYFAPSNLKHFIFKREEIKMLKKVVLSVVGGALLLVGVLKQNNVDM